MSLRLEWVLGLKGRGHWHSFEEKLHDRMKRKYSVFGKKVVYIDRIEGEGGNSKFFLVFDDGSANLFDLEALNNDNLRSTSSSRDSMSLSRKYVIIDGKESLFGPIGLANEISWLLPELARRRGNSLLLLTSQGTILRAESKAGIEKVKINGEAKSAHDFDDSDILAFAASPEFEYAATWRIDGEIESKRRKTVAILRLSDMTELTEVAFPGNVSIVNASFSGENTLVVLCKEYRESKTSEEASSVIYTFRIKNNELKGTEKYRFKMQFICFGFSQRFGVIFAASTSGHAVIIFQGQIIAKRPLKTKVRLKSTLSCAHTIFTCQALPIRCIVHNSGCFCLYQTSSNEFIFTDFALNVLELSHPVLDAFSRMSESSIIEALSFHVSESELHETALLVHISDALYSFIICGDIVHGFEGISRIVYGQHGIKGLITMARCTISREMSSSFYPMLLDFLKSLPNPYEVMITVAKELIDNNDQYLGRATSVSNGSYVNTFLTDIAYILCRAGRLAEAALLVFYLRDQDLHLFLIGKATMSGDTVLSAIIEADCFE